FFQAEDGIRDDLVTGVQTCALPIFGSREVGQNKAAGLRERLERTYPHIASVTHHEGTWQEALTRDENLFAEADLVVVAIGSWHEIGRASCRGRGEGGGGGGGRRQEK